MKQIYWNTELYHIGIKGRSGRYPAGSGDRPKTGPRAFWWRKRKERLEIQRAVNNANLRNARKTGENLSLYQKRKEKLDRKMAKYNEKNKQNIKKELNEPVKKLTQSEKEALKRSGDPKKILAYKTQFTDDELKAVSLRIGYEKKIQEVSAEQTKATFDKLKSMAETARTVSDAIDKGYKTYNSIFGESGNTNNKNETVENVSKSSKKNKKKKK